MILLALVLKSPILLIIFTNFDSPSFRKSSAVLHFLNNIFVTENGQIVLGPAKINLIC